MLKYNKYFIIIEYYPALILRSSINEKKKKKVGPVNTYR